MPGNARAQRRRSPLAQLGGTVFASRQHPETFTKHVVLTFPRHPAAGTSRSLGGGSNGPEHGRYRLGAHSVGPGAVHDTRASRSSTAAWCGPRTCSRCSCRTSSRWASSRSSGWSFGFSLAFGDFGNGGFIGNFDYAGLKDMTERRGRHVRGRCARPRVRRVPADVRGDHARAHHRRHRRPHAVRRRGSASSRCGRSSCTSPVAHWVFGGGWLPNAARSTSPAARSCT